MIFAWERYTPKNNLYAQLVDFWCECYITSIPIVQRLWFSLNGSIYSCLRSLQSYKVMILWFQLYTLYLVRKKISLEYFTRVMSKEKNKLEMQQKEKFLSRKFLFNFQNILMDLFFFSFFRCKCFTRFKHYSPD